MGRRKIEIKAIKDDRNRSVTFLKRKGGLFKKAHELSVLCSVDVAVIIFGQNKKLYEYSSNPNGMRETLMRYQYYQGPHEKKGPGDFGDRDDDDEDEDDQVGSPGPDEQSTPPSQSMYLQSQQHNQHLRHGPPPGSPPIPNGVYAPRMSTPQPQVISRPSSRTHRRISSNLVPVEHSHPQNHQGQPSYGPYNQNPSYYPSGQPTHTQMQMHPHQGTPPPPTQNQAFSHPVPHRTQMQQMYLQEQRRQSMPHNFPIPQERPQSVPISHPSPPPQLSRPFQSPPLPGSPNKIAAPAPSRTHSIYTPVDDRRSVLAQHWEAPRVSDGEPRHDEATDSGGLSSNARSQSIDVGSASRQKHINGVSHHQSFVPPAAPNRNGSPVGSSSGSAPNTGTFPPPSRVNSIQSDAKRPRLTVQIPSEQSDAEGATGVTASTSVSPKEGAAASGNASQSTPAKPSGPAAASAAAAAAVVGTNNASGPSSAQSRSTGSVVLPPPSPSANSASASGVLSAGATGPNNPFARPLPPHAVLGAGQAPQLNTSVGNLSKEAMDTATPMSALPSRFMSDGGLLPSPSSFYPDWSFPGSGNSNNLASPAIYQPTPVRETGGGWRDEDRERDRLGKRKISDEAGRDEKKMKS